MQSIKPMNILLATLKLKLEPRVDHCMASGVVDQIATTDKNTQ
jgi:hypothetical protein